MSLRTRIAVAAAAAVAAVSIALGGIGYASTRSQLIDGVRQQLLQRSAPTIARHSSDTDNDPRQDGRICSRGAPLQIPQPELGGAPGYFQSVCPNGLAVADGGGTPQLPVTPRVLALARAAHGRFFFTAMVKDTHLEILATGDPSDHKAVEVALPLTTVDRTLHGLSVTFLVLVGIGIALAAALGLLIARAAVAPILRFTSRTEAVTSALERPGRLEEDGPAELCRLAASFNQTLDALEQSVEAQRHLIADASHELRTPMAALRSNIQIFLDAGRLPAGERLELQQAIVVELDELTQLVSDVLELARGSAPSDHTEPIDLDGAVRDAVERAGRRAPGLRFDCDLEPTVVQHTPEAVTRAVTNVLYNARKWSPDGGVVEVTLQGGVLTVRDHGPGFDAADLDHVFERFYRSDRARRMPGSGLGLAIVKQVAEARGGFATAERAPGGGALVRVAFAPVGAG